MDDVEGILAAADSRWKMEHGLEIYHTMVTCPPNSSKLLARFRWQLPKPC